MNPVPFPEANRVLTAPAGVSPEDCGDLHVLTDGSVCVSAWRPSLEEVGDLLAGKPLWVHVWSGQTQPPIALTTIPPFGSEESNDAA